VIFTLLCRMSIIPAAVPYCGQATEKKQGSRVGEELRIALPRLTLVAVHLCPIAFATSKKQPSTTPLAWYRAMSEPPLLWRNLVALRVS